jgi:hypothetical protein
MAADTRQQAHDRAKQRRLAGAIRADDGDHPAFGDDKADAVQYLHLVVAGVQAVDPQ